MTNAQTFGAQYAWFSPLVNGNSLESNCGSCPISRNGPKEATKTTMTVLAREINRVGRILPWGDMQWARRRYTKYAGCGDNKKVWWAN